MAERSATEALMDMWKQQIEEGTKAWTQAMGRTQTVEPEQLWRPFMDQGIAAWAKLMAQGPVSPDLMAQWKRFLDQWIAAWGEALEHAMGTEAFAQALGRYLDQWLTVQAPATRAGAEATDATLSALGIPSRSQVSQVARQLADLEDRIERLEDTLGTRAGHGTDSGPAPNTRRGRAKRPASKKSAR